MCEVFTSLLTWKQYYVIWMSLRWWMVIICRICTLLFYIFIETFWVCIQVISHLFHINIDKWKLVHCPLNVQHSPPLSLHSSSRICVFDFFCAFIFDFFFLGGGGVFGIFVSFYVLLRILFWRFSLFFLRSRVDAFKSR